MIIFLTSCYVARQATVKTKRHRKDSSASDSGDNSEDSDFKMSASDPASEEESDLSEVESSDFSGGTDSDGIYQYIYTRK